MSDIRTKIILGTTISAVSVMLVMAVSIGAVQNNVSAPATLGLVGHFEIMVENPDGTVYYVQGDNTVTGPGKDGIGTDAFSDGANGPWLCMQLGIGPNVAAADAIFSPLTDTDQACDATPAGNCDQAGTFGPTVANVCTIVATATIDDTGGVDANDQCIPNCTLVEVQLENAAGTNVFAQTALSDDVIVNTQADVTVTYVIGVGGTIP